MKQVLLRWDWQIKSYPRACSRLPGQCIVISSGGETCGSRCTGSRALSSSFDFEGNWGQEVPHRNDSPCRLSASVSHVCCTLKLWREFACTQMCMEAPECKWISFSGGQQAGEGGRVATLQVDYFYVSQGPACVQKKVRGQSGQPPPKSVGCFPHWNEVKDVLKCFLHCNLNVEWGDRPEVWKCWPLLPRRL